MLLRLLGMVFASALLLGVPASAIAVEARELQGKYAIKGTLNGKPDYEQTAEIVFKQGNTIEVTVKDGKQTWIGLGKLNGNKLKITAQRARGQGETMEWEYRVKQNGELYAEWKEGKRQFTETWTRKK